MNCLRSQDSQLVVAMLTTTENELYEVSKPYVDTFTGLGELRGVIYHVNLHKGFQGVVKPARSVALALCEKAKVVLD